ncbi:MAG TPA: hypothetical protein VFQ61_21015, partial [Polyangiaceae bacterium]|nr:hypothetical protein [Polyangiaceae bacterium]
IDEAINTHYLATDFDKAEAVLTGTIKACDDKCSPQTLAKAWMYVGIVRGSGRNDQGGAKEAFQTALGLDPGVKLDAGLATPETQTTFQHSGGGGAVETPVAPVASGGEEEASGGGEGLTCTPVVTEVETRRPVPVQCRSEAEVTNMELRYKSFGSESWKTLRMEPKDGSFRAQIPCDATQNTGLLKIYVVGKNPKGKANASWGTKAQPIELSILEGSTAEPPSYDDADPPPRCEAKEICPPDFPGCGGNQGGTVDLGGQCQSSSQCQSGLVCMDGTCESAPSCKTNDDCPAGTCEEGRCSAQGGEQMSGRARKWWVGLHVAQDIAFFGGDKVCLGDAGFACYVTGENDLPYDTDYYQTKAVGRVNSGAVPGTTRVLLSIDRLLMKNITFGARLGFAFRGGPPAGKQMEWDPDGDPNTKDYLVKSDGTKFLPVHAELRGTYWFGNNPLGRRGFRPYVHAGLGVGQVDAKVVVSVDDKDTVNSPVPLTADAWKKMGTMFATVGGGVVYALTPRLGIQGNLNLMLMFPDSGLNVQPSLGMVFGL